MTTHTTPKDLDGHARACYREAATHLSARTVAALHQRRASILTAAPTCPTTHWWGRLLPVALAGVAAIALSVELRPPAPPTHAPMAFMTSDEVPATRDALDALDTLDALNTLTLTALDEDPDFFLWLATYETSLLAME